MTRDVSDNPRDEVTLTKSSSVGVSGSASDEARELAQFFHETYERLAPQFGYETRVESAVPWSEVPDNNRRLMEAVCAELLAGDSPLSERLVGVSADVSRLTAERDSYLSRLDTVNVVRQENEVRAILAEARVAVLREALTKAHNFCCGCERPGSTRLCIAPEAFGAFGDLLAASPDDAEAKP